MEYYNGACRDQAQYLVKIWRERGKYVASTEHEFAGDVKFVGETEQFTVDTVVIMHNRQCDNFCSECPLKIGKSSTRNISSENH